jgi:hypothetical protein
MTRPIQDTSVLRKARIQKFATTVLGLQTLLDASREDQFMTSRAAVEQPEDMGIRSLGMVRDPTASIAADRGRIQLREAWLNAEAVILDAYAKVNEAGLALQLAHDRFLGVERLEQTSTEATGDDLGPQNQAA